MKTNRSGIIVLLLILVLAATLGRYDTVGAKTSQPVPVPTGLVSWWPGDGDATDIRDGNNGTLNGGATFALGLVDQAFSFDGVDNWVNLGTSTTLAPSLFTIDLWMKQSAVNPGNAALATR